MLPFVSFTKLEGRERDQYRLPQRPDGQNPLGCRTLQQGGSVIPG